jgi:hypothetical protein
MGKYSGGQATVPATSFKCHMCNTGYFINAPQILGRIFRFLSGRGAKIQGGGHNSGEPKMHTPVI